jgi:hypothetical protein
MSRENKVNPGQYTQRGRLTADENAQEMSKQRASVSEQRTGSGSKAAPRQPAGRQKKSAGNDDSD